MILPPGIRSVAVASGTQHWSVPADGQGHGVLAERDAMQDLHTAACASRKHGVRKTDGQERWTLATTAKWTDIVSGVTLFTV